MQSESKEDKQVALPCHELVIEATTMANSKECGTYLCVEYIYKYLCVPCTIIMLYIHMQIHMHTYVYIIYI